MSVLPFHKPAAASNAVSRTIDAFDSDTEEVLSRTKPAVESIILRVIAVMFTLVVILMIVIKIDRVVTAPGQIIPVDGTIVVQPLETAIIHSILVKVGDSVKKGQLLATMDPTFAAADLSQLQQKEQSLEAEVARLRAEHDGKEFKGSGASPYQALQEAIWQQRQAQFRSSLTDYDERQSSAESAITRLEQDMDLLKTRLKLAGDIETMRTELEKRDVGSKLNSMVAQDSRLQDEQSMASDVNMLAGARHDLQSLKAQRDVFIQQWQSSLGLDLVDKSDQLYSARQYLTEAQELRDLADVRAPDDAVVLEIAQLSVGSVAQAGNPLFTLVPAGAKLEAEVEIGNMDVGFPRIGDEVQLKLDAFPYTQHGTAQGILKSISEDSFTTLPDGTTAPAFFKARVEIKDTHLKNVPASFRLLPGMTLQGDIMVGKRRIITYITEGALRTGTEAMREP